MATTPMLDPTGIARMVPGDKVDLATKAGGKPAFKLLDPTGTPRWVPKDQVPTALQHKGKFFNDAESHRFSGEPQGGLPAPVITPPPTPQGLLGIDRHKVDQVQHTPIYQPPKPFPAWLSEPLRPKIAAVADKIDSALEPQGAKDWKAKQKAKMDAYDKDHPIQASVAQGIDDYLDGMSTPTNLAVMVLAPESRVISTFFAAQAAKGSYDSAGSAYKAWKEGKNADAAKFITDAGLNALTAAAAGTHAVRGEVVPKPKPTIEPDAVDRYIAQEAAKRKAEAGTPEQATETPRVKAEQKAQGIEAKRAARAAKKAAKVTEPPKPEEPVMAQKVKAAIEKPITRKPTEPEDEGIARVAEEVRKSTERSKPPSIEDAVYEFAGKRNLDPESLAEDIRKKPRARQSGEEKAFLANYAHWKGEKPLSEPPKPKEEPKAAKPAAKPPERKVEALAEPPKPEVVPDSTVQSTAPEPGTSTEDGKEVAENLSEQPKGEVQPSPAGQRLGTAPLTDFTVDPEVFQFRHNVNKKGVTRKFEDTQFNQELAGPITAWDDPKTGKRYVVNGHHRFEMAERSGEKNIDFKLLDSKRFPTRESARAQGAIENIAEGNGSATDVTQFLRESGRTLEELQKHGVSPQIKIATDGAELAKLDDQLFHLVATGQMKESRGVEIGRATADPAQQVALVKMISDYERKGRKVTDETIQELGRFAQSAGTTTQTNFTLFGPEEETRSLAIPKAEVSAYVKEQYANEHRAFAAGANEGKAAILSTQEGNALNVGENAKRAAQLKQDEEAYNLLSMRSGKVDEILNQAAQEIADGKDPGATKRKAYEGIQAAIQETLPRGKGPATGVEPQEPAGLFADTETGRQVEADRRKQGAIQKASTHPFGQSETVTDTELQDRKLVGPPPKDPNPVREAFDQAIDTATRVMEPVGRILAPGSVNRAAEITAVMSKRAMASVANNMARAMHDLNRGRAALDRLGPQGRINFMIAAEGGNRFENPKLQALAEKWWDIQQAAWKQIQRRTGVKTFIENFMPHLWKDEAKAGEFYRGWVGSRSLEGVKTFMKARELPTIEDGLKAGLQLASDDPIEMMARKLQEMNKFIAFHDMFQEMKTLGQAKFVFGTFGNTPGGWREMPRPWGTQYAPEQITYRDAVDHILNTKLNDLAEKLGIAVKRDDPITDGLMGEADINANEIRVRIASTMGTLAHEIGHFIDHKVGYGGVSLGDALTKKGIYAKELRALADLRGEGKTVSANQKAYFRKKSEKIANLVDALVNTPWLLDGSDPRAVAPNVGDWFKKYVASNPKLAPLLDIHPSLSREILEHDLGGKLQVAGHWYAPASSVQLLENMTSVGLGSNPLYRAARGVTNGVLAWRLGLSGRHYLFTSLEPAMSRWGIAAEDFRVGRIKSGLANMGRGTLFPVEATRGIATGRKAIRAFFGEGPIAAENASIFRDVTEAGGRAQMDREYMVGALRQTMKHFRQGNLLRSGLYAIGAAPEAVAYPLQHIWVPAIKMSVAMENFPVELAKDPHSLIDVFDYGREYFAGLDDAKKEYATDVVRALHEGGEPPDPPDGMHYLTARRIEQRAGEIYNLSAQMKKREVLQRVWNSVDNRLGQMTYDNLLWNRATKDLGQILYQAMGWRLGFREFPLGAKDLVKGKWSPRARYLLMYPLQIALVSAIYQYLKTGQTPQSIKDYFFPHNGHVAPDGQAERVALPSYVTEMFKDVQGFRYGLREGIKSLYQSEVVGAMNPTWPDIAEMVNNRNFYGTEIYSENDPAWKQAFKEIEFGFTEQTPYSIRNAQKLKGELGESASNADYAEAFFGISKAPSIVDQTPAQHLISQYLEAHRGSGTMTSEQFESRELRNQLVAEIKKNGGPTAATNKEISDYIKEGKLKPASRSLIRQQVRLSKFQFQFRELPLEDALRVWDAASEDERKAIRGELAKKRHLLKNIPAERRADVRKRLDAALGMNRPLSTTMISAPPAP